MYVAPSILSADFGRLNEEITKFAKQEPTLSMSMLWTGILCQISQSDRLL